MKLKLTAGLIFSIFCIQQTQAQYKDLEGSFFGKIVALGVGGSIQQFDKEMMGTATSITALNYSIFLSPKRIMSFKLAFPQGYSRKFEGNDGNQDYVVTNKFKFIESEVGYNFGITKGGFDKPTSLFINVQAGIIFTKWTVTDSRSYNPGPDHVGNVFFGAGLSAFQRLGKRFVLNIEPSYRFDRSGMDSGLWMDDEGTSVSLTNFRAHVGLLYLLGKSE